MCSANAYAANIFGSARPRWHLVASPTPAGLVKSRSFRTSPLALLPVVGNITSILNPLAWLPKGGNVFNPFAWAQGNILNPLSWMSGSVGIMHGSYASGLEYWALRFPTTVSFGTDVFTGSSVTTGQTEVTAMFLGPGRGVTAAAR